MYIYIYIYVLFFLLLMMMMMDDDGGRCRTITWCHTEVENWYEAPHEKKSRTYKSHFIKYKLDHTANILIVCTTLEALTTNYALLIKNYSLCTTHYEQGVC